MSSRFGGIGMRLLTSAFVLPIVIALICVPALSPGFVVLASVVVAFGLAEFAGIARARGIDVQPVALVAIGTIVAASAFQGNLLITGLTLYGAVMALALLMILSGRRTVAGFGTSVLGVVYVGWFGSHMVLLHVVPDTGSGLVLLLLGTSVLTDSAAYFVGTMIGRHKLAPAVSPKKSWEGAIGGLLFAVGGMALVHYFKARYGFETLPEWSMTRYLLTGAVLSIVGQLGDLAESCLKRDAGIKDSGTLFPGHGGALDRCDGLLFAAPALYYMAML